MTEEEANQRLETMEADISDFRIQLAENTASITTLQSLTSELLSIIRIQQQGLRLLQQQATEERQAFQAEIQRIWEYLLSERPNGRDA